MKKPNKFKEAGIGNNDLFEMGTALIKESGEAVVFAHNKADGSGVELMACNTTGIDLRALCVGILADIFRVSERMGLDDKVNIHEVTQLVLDALREAKQKPIN